MLNELFSWDFVTEYVLKYVTLNFLFSELLYNITIALSIMPLVWVRNDIVIARVILNYYVNLDSGILNSDRLMAVFSAQMFTNTLSCLVENIIVRIAIHNIGWWRHDVAVNYRLPYWFIKTWHGCFPTVFLLLENICQVESPTDTKCSKKSWRQ